MLEPQEMHLKSIKADFQALVDTKYRKGAEEHKGDLLAARPSDLIDLALEEAIDQVVYLLTLRDKLVEVKNKL